MEVLHGGLKKRGLFFAPDARQPAHDLARMFHEDVLQAQQLGSWQGFADFDPAGNAVALSRKAKFGKSCQGARGARRGPFAKPGVRVHEISGLVECRRWLNWRNSGVWMD